ncbi:hypothetical protein MNV49_000964 [Pseudohyphozyma bogoriensis]|nr:hypothetical protein MNV49_000964 [Pseudohyphozyma bogoriensis]
MSDRPPAGSGPRKPTIIKRAATTTPSTSTTPARPAKRPRHRSTIGAKQDGDDSSRLVAAKLYAEHLGGGVSSLSTRKDPERIVESLIDISLAVSARGLVKVLKLPQRDDRAMVSKVGWDPSKRRQQLQTDASEGTSPAELRDYIKELPSGTANRLFSQVIRLIMNEQGKEEIAALPLATIFLHSNTTSLSFSALSAPSLLLHRIPDCTSLASLDLAAHATLNDKTLAAILSKLKTLEKVVLRACTKVGDASVIELSKAAESRLREVNLGFTAVTIKSLTALLSRCSRLEVLKLANIQGLNERNVTKLVDESTSGAIGWRHIPLSNLKTLKVRSTEITDSSLGRLLTLCALSLTRLDISFTQVKTLDIVSSALHATPEWRLEKLNASGLPLTQATLVGFFEPLSRRPEVERSRFAKLRLGSMKNVSVKCPGLTDAVFAKVVPLLEKLSGLRSVGLFQNWDLGKQSEPMSRFMKVVGRRCTFLDLTLHLQSYHLEGLLPDLEPPLEDFEEESALYDGPPRIQTLVLDSSKITDEAALAIGQCKDLRSLHISETKITTEFLKEVMRECLKLTTLNLSSCRGVPVTQRRNFFEEWEKGNVA